MNVFDNLIHRYQAVEEQPVDEQIVLLCRNSRNAVPADIVLAQYKFCLMHGIKDDDACVLKQYLVMLTSEDDVRRLEVL